MDFDASTLSLTVGASVEYVGLSADGNFDDDFNLGTTYWIDFQSFSGSTDSIDVAGSCGNREAADYSGLDFADYWSYPSNPEDLGTTDTDERMAYPPSDWVIDADGNHTNDPTKLKGGALLPLGGSEGYKGTGLGAMVEILCGLLTGLGFGVEPTGRHNDGCFLAVFNVEAFRPLADFKNEVADFAQNLNETPPMEGSSGVLYPGEIEKIQETERRAGGIPIEEAAWKRLTDLAAELGVNPDIAQLIKRILTRYRIVGVFDAVDARR